MKTRTQVIHEILIVDLGQMVSNKVELVATKIDAAREQGARILKYKAWMGYTGKTAGQGPLVVGYSTEESDTDIQEAMAADPQHVEDGDESEEGKRRVYPIWVIPKVGSDGNNIERSYRNIPMAWREIDEGRAFNWFVQNVSGATITDAGEVIIAATWVQEWLRD